jgi:nicotinamidase-related amidase
MLAGLSRDRAALFVVDIQDKLIPAMTEAAVAEVTRNSKLLILAARTLGLPIVVSEQYPRGLGHTTAAIREALEGADGVHLYEKLEFSGAGAPAFAALAPRLRRDQWIVCGMETHVCVYQTARDLVARGYAAHVCADAVCSRAVKNYELGLGLMARAGAVITSTEATIFDLLGRAGSDEFRTLSKAIR